MRSNEIDPRDVTKVKLWKLENCSKPADDYVINEKILTVQIDGVGSFTLLCTPSNLEELALGFAFTEGLIDSSADVSSISQKHDNNGSIVSMQIRNPDRVKTKRNLIVTSGCGMCGKNNIENTIASTPAVKNSLKFNIKELESLEKNIGENQSIFRTTGGAHAAAFFDQQGTIIAMHEDVGRHNALDKTIGYCLTNKISTCGLGLFLSSRISFEMVLKAVKAGIELIMGVSAPTDMAIKSAKYWNITLCGFVRHGKGNIYTGKERIEGVNF